MPKLRIRQLFNGKWICEIETGCWWWKMWKGVTVTYYSGIAPTDKPAYVSEAAPGSMNYGDKMQDTREKCVKIMIDIQSMYGGGGSDEQTTIASHQ